MSQLTNYIQKELDKGFNKDIITKKLLQAGYTKQEIQESFTSLKAAEPLLRRKFLDTIHTDVHVRWSRWVFPLLAIGLLVFFGYLLFLYIEGRPAVEEVTACDEISDVQEKDICYLQLAAGGEDVCDKLKNSAFKRACSGKIWETDSCLYEQFIEQVSESCKIQLGEEDCERQEDYVGCITELAVENNDPELCQGKASCITQLAISNKDGSFCTTYLSLSSEECIDDYYQVTGDATYCQLGDIACGYVATASDAEKQAFFEKHIAILDEESKNEYLWDFAVEYKEPLACSYISETEEMTSLLENYELLPPDVCVMGVAYQSQDSTICDAFTETHKKSLCIDMLTCTETTVNEDLCHELQ